MADLAALQKQFPTYKIRSQPAHGCSCRDGIRTTPDGIEHPCLCICMDAPEPGEVEYRVEVGQALGAAARKLRTERV